MVSAYCEVPPGIDLRALMHLGLVASAHVRDRAGLRAALSEAMDHGRADMGFVPHAALDHYVMLSLRKGADDRLYGVLSDASLHHAQLAAVEQARSEAEMHNIGKTQFVASMSHELRTPLNSILGYAQILHVDATIPPARKDAIGVIRRSGEHLLSLIDGLLDIAKIE
eukprot:gene25632-32952_t